MEDIEESSNSSSIETKTTSKSKQLHSSKNSSEKSRLSESESSSSWENKHVKSYDFDDNIRYPKTPERRLKLTIRVKRSPTTSNSNSCSSFQHDFESGVESEPQYEIIRASEGIHSDMELSEFELESLPASEETLSKKSKRKKRHKRKKNKYRDAIERDEEEKQAENGTTEVQPDEPAPQQPSKSLSFAATTTKRVKLLFGNEMKILNIPESIGKETSSLDAANSLKGRILLTKCL